MFAHRRLSLLAVPVALVACRSAGDQAGPSPPAVSVVATRSPTNAPPPEDRARHERLAERIAKALRDPGFRGSVLAALDQSPYREHKVHLQRFLGDDHGRERLRLGRLAGEADARIQTDLDDAGPVELYFPVTAHRQRWRGDADLIVATAEIDGDAPVGFDLFGRRLRLDPNTPPITPVLMVSRAEQSFAPATQATTCIFQCGGGTGSGTGGGGVTQIAGLYLTQTQFTQTFESWFKGEPEFEVHVLGQDGTSKQLISYQCAGENAGAFYTFDQNGTSWSGTVLLFSMTQFDQYHAAHPNQNVRIFVVEDDDTACQIKVDSTRASRLFGELKTVYSGLTGGRDSVGVGGVLRFFRRAFVLYDLFAAAASFIKTDDDIVGNAVADSAAASTFFPGANWVVKGENSVATGALRLEMRN
jgi:hypothetical protein